MTEQYITVGEIVNTQGVQGEVRVIPATDFPERFFKMKKVLVLHKGQRQEYVIERAREHKQFIILKFAEVSDMTAAEKLKGALLQITPAELTPLPPGSYYQFQIIGLEVIDEQGRSLGTVTNILRTGANDVYEVKRPAGKDLLIPALKSVIKKIDLPAGKMEVVLPEGLLE
ncbi:ribosome maturation factor RimM [Desulforamulus ferrireducens]|uniref:Ribosome maturation factor RimM n=1 Tax=Desulforamulus ferrireducens TaxID=1833852 RepID=A0A1S6IXB9_9FIRM|nr:ribosome maturation factor RimM [Desulforamulus ferrireducens]AQS59426.1 16S rRNA processing protein RimM [Desulforamulus ferrireducens]